jgi:hypothetical protein
MRLMSIVTSAVVLSVIACSGASEGGSSPIQPEEEVGEIGQELFEPGCLLEQPQGTIVAPPNPASCVARLGGGSTCSAAAPVNYGRPTCPGQFIADATQVLGRHIQFAAIGTVSTSPQSVCGGRKIEAMAQGFTLLGWVDLGRITRNDQRVCPSPGAPQWPCSCQLRADFAELPAVHPYLGIRIVARTTATALPGLLLPVTSQVPRSDAHAYSGHGHRGAAFSGLLFR